MSVLKGAEFNQHLSQALQNQLQEVLGLDADTAELLADHAVFAISQELGGALVYLGKTDSHARSKLYQVMWDAFKGDNHAELAQRYKLSVQQVYKIIKAVGKIEKAKRQLGLQL